jgi:hypothetical protein
MRGGSKKEPDHPAQLLDTSHACIATFVLSSRAIVNPQSNPRETLSVCLPNTSVVSLLQHVPDPAADGSISGMISDLH